MTTYQQAMADRFQNAQWYIGGGDELNTIIYDASDLEGTGPDGHGMVCQDGQHRCFNTDQPCGCRCDDCRDDTEPRCDICNGLINKYGSAIGHCENESDHSGRA